MNFRQLKQAKEEIALKNEFFEAFKQTDKGCLIKESLVLTFCIVTLCLILTHNISWPGLGPGHNNREIQTTLHGSASLGRLLPTNYTPVMTTSKDEHSVKTLNTEAK